MPVKMCTIKEMSQLLVEYLTVYLSKVQRVISIKLWFNGSATPLLNELSVTGLRDNQYYYVFPVLIQRCAKRFPDANIILSLFIEKKTIVFYLPYGFFFFKNITQERRGCVWSCYVVILKCRLRLQKSPNAIFVLKKKGNIPPLTLRFSVSE